MSVSAVNVETPVSVVRVKGSCPRSGQRMMQGNPGDCGDSVCAKDNEAFPVIYISVLSGLNTSIEEL